MMAGVRFSYDDAMLTTLLYRITWAVGTYSWALVSFDASYPFFQEVGGERDLKWPVAALLVRIIMSIFAEYLGQEKG